jgi:hypothetical protein
VLADAGARRPEEAFVEAPCDDRIVPVRARRVSRAAEHRRELVASLRSRDRGKAAERLVDELGNRLARGELKLVDEAVAGTFGVAAVKRRER